MIFVLTDGFSCDLEFANVLLNIHVGVENPGWLIQSG